MLTLRGMAAVRGQLMAAGPSYRRALGAALYREGQRIMAISARLVPVKTTRLRSSAYTAPPKTSGGNVSVEIGYGTDYAVPVHERTYARHTVGQAKYLEKPVQEARAGYTQRLAADTRRMARMGKGFGG